MSLDPYELSELATFVIMSTGVVMVVTSVFQCVRSCLCTKRT